jgi:hypothetical protein
MHRKTRKMSSTPLTNNGMEIPLDSVQKKCTRESLPKNPQAKKLKRPVYRVH